MKDRVLTFVDGKFYKDFPSAAGITAKLREQIPVGTYIYLPDGGHWRAHWYLFKWNSFTPINLSDVPKEIKAALLILI
jgi:hypothetical protein